MEILNYLGTNIFKQPPFFMGIIALVGLLLQKKDIGSVIKGTAKTIMGVIILFVGVNFITAAASPLATAFATLYKLPKASQFDGSLCWEVLGSYGAEIGLALALSFVINLLVAKFTPLKNIFLTGHIYFWMAYLAVAAGVQGGLSGAPLIGFATIGLSLYIIISPALLRPLVKKVTGSDDFTIGHTAGIFCLMGYGIGKLFKGKSKSTEEMNIPKGLDFFRDTTVASSILMVVTYIIVGLIIGPNARQEVYGGALPGIATIGGMQYDLFSFSVIAGMNFGAGLTILLTGVRMMLGEIIPAFKGISEKIIPNAIPALDIPMIFPYAPNALLVGFVTSMITSILTIVVMAATGTMVFAVIPLTVACFFDIAPAAVFANKEGGRIGAVVASAVGGVVMILLLTFSIGLTLDTAAGFNQIYGGNDFSLFSGLSSWIAGLF
ncbi:MAG: PTS ascorbate transporter subunit IIC [Lachnospiraceae bacterium]